MKITEKEWLNLYQSVKNEECDCIHWGRCPGHVSIRRYIPLAAHTDEISQAGRSGSANLHTC